MQELEGLNVHKYLILSIFIISWSYSLVAFATTDELKPTEQPLSTDYSSNIDKLIKNGALTPQEGKYHLLKINLSTPEQKQHFNNQVRDVANKINKVKVYQFKNSPIEIQLK